MGEDAKKKMKIPREKWQWFGEAGHFICANDCRFNLTTRVGKYVVSSVGLMVQDNKEKEIGLARKYKTMVFKFLRVADCGCCIEWTGSELDMCGYNDGKSATVGHYALCAKWANKQ
jgi:hypothetical protein